MVNNVIRNIRLHAQKAGLKLTAPLTVHTLRKSFAQNHTDSGTPMATLKEMMGHSSIQTTQQFYLQKSSDSEAAAVKRYESLLPQIDVKLTYGRKKGRKGPSAENPISAVNPHKPEG